MFRLRLVLAVFFIPFLLLAPSFAATFTFAGPDPNDPNPGDASSWFNPKNWRPNGVPGTGDTAVLNSPANFVVNLGSTSTAVGALELSTGTLAGASTATTLTVFNTLNWTGGALRTVTLSLSSNGVANVSGANAKFLIGSKLNNNGTVHFSGAGQLFGGDGASVNNRSGGIFNLNVDGAPFAYTNVGARPTFNNLAGATFAKTAGTGAINVTNWIFNHSGTVNAAVREITFNTTLNITDGATFTGRVTRLASGLVTLSGTATANNTSVIIEGGAIRGGSSIATAATLAGIGARGWLWAGGGMSGVVKVPPGTVFSIAGANTKTLSGRLLNNGTINLNATGPISGGTLTNQRGGAFNIQVDGTPFSATRIDNLSGATFAKTAGSGTTTINTPFTNNGEIKTATGILAFNAALNLNDGGRFTGAGRTQIVGGNVTLNGTTTVSDATLEIIGGNLTGGGVAGAAGTFATTGSGLWNWQGGKLLGTLNVAPDSVFNISGATEKVLDGAALTNYGTLNSTAGINAGNAAVFTNAEGATFNARSFISGWSNGFGTRPLFVNAGTLNMPGPGLFLLTAEFRQTATGTLNMSIGGANDAFNQRHDQLSVNGPTTLNGRLNAKLINGFVPATGSSFTVLGHGSRSGTFANVTPPFTPVYASNTTSLTVGSGALLFVGLSESSVAEGNNIIGTVTRVASGSAASDSITVNLSTSGGQITTAPTVTLPANTASNTFVIAASDDAIAEGLQSATVTASAPGFTAGSASVTVLDNDGAALELSLPLLIGEGSTVTGTVTRNTTTDTPLTVTLLSGNGARLSVPSTITIPIGATSATFTVTAPQNTIDEVNPIVSLTADASGFAGDSAQVSIKDDDKATLILELPPSINESGIGVGTIRRNVDDVSRPLTVALSSNNPRLLVPATVTIPADSLTAGIALSAPNDTNAEGGVSATVTATANGFTPDSKSLTINDNDGLRLTLDDDAINEGQSNVRGTVTRLTTNNSAALTVNLSSDKPNTITVPATITIPAGATSATFTVSAPQNIRIEGDQTVTLSAGANGFVPVSATILVREDDDIRIDSFTPTNGIPPLTITIKGADFSGATSVKFNGVEANFIVDHTAQIRATLPSNASTGRISVTARSGATAFSATNFVVNPGIKLFTPESGSPGTMVVIEGWGLNGATSVKFNGVPATFTVNSVQKITATVPNNATTGPISITTAAGSVTSDKAFVVCSANVTARVRVTTGALQPAGYAGGALGGANYKQTVTLQNISTTAINSPLSLVLDNLTPGVTLTNRSGLTVCAAPLNSPFINVSAGSDNRLSPNETVSITLYFQAASSPIDFTPRVLAESSNR